MSEALTVEERVAQQITKLLKDHNLELALGCVDVGAHPEMPADVVWICKEYENYTLMFKDQYPCLVRKVK